MNKCQSCGKERRTKTAMIDGKYWKAICDPCIGNVEQDDEVTSAAAGYERRRQYEDNAQDTIQPYNANGPNVEFLRLYPEAAHKTFDKKTIEELKRKI